MLAYKLSSVSFPKAFVMKSPSNLAILHGEEINKKVFDTCKWSEIQNVCMGNELRLVKEIFSKKRDGVGVGSHTDTSRGENRNLEKPSRNSRMVRLFIL